MAGNDAEDLRVAVARLEGKIDALANLLAAYHGSFARLEGRVWGLLVAVVIAMGTALLGIVVK